MIYPLVYQGLVEIVFHTRGLGILRSFLYSQTSQVFKTLLSEWLYKPCSDATLLNSGTSQVAVIESDTLFYIKMLELRLSALLCYLGLEISFHSS